MIIKRLITCLFLIFICVEAHGQEWAQPQTPNDSAIIIQSALDNGSVYNATLNPTGTNVSASGQNATQPPLIVMTGSSPKVVGAIQLDNGHVWVKDESYNTWIMVPDSTFQSNFTFTTDALHSSAWSSWEETGSSVYTDYNWDLGCNPGPYGTGTAWAYSYNSGSFNRSIGGGNVFLVSWARTWYESGVDISPDPHFGLPGFQDGSVFASWGGNSYVTYQWGNLSLSFGGAFGFFVGRYVCNTWPSVHRVSTSRFDYPFIGSAGLLRNSATSSDSWGLLCGVGGGSGSGSCVIGTNDGSQRFTLGEAEAFRMTDVGNYAAGLYTYASANLRLFFKGLPSYPYSGNLYSVNYAAGVIELVGNIGSAVPTACYVDVVAK